MDLLDIVELGGGGDAQGVCPVKVLDTLGFGKGDSPQGKIPVETNPDPTGFEVFSTLLHAEGCSKWVECQMFHIKPAKNIAVITALADIGASWVRAAYGVHVVFVLENDEVAVVDYGEFSVGALDLVFGFTSFLPNIDERVRDLACIATGRSNTKSRCVINVEMTLESQDHPQLVFGREGAGSVELFQVESAGFETRGSRSNLTCCQCVSDW